MELAELLEREGLEPDALMTWARGRADALVAELAPDEQLLRLLGTDASIDVGALRFERVAPDEVELVAVELEEDTVVGARREPPQPITVDELPPPPEPPLHAEGQPEPMLETFDTGPIDLGTPEAEELLAATPPLAEPEPEAAKEAESASEDELEEIELDELVELADDELEALDELDDPEDPLPPRRPPPPGQPPIRTGDTASFAAVDQADQADQADQVDQVDQVDQADQAPVRTGDTAAHMVIPSGEEDEFEDVDLDAPHRASGRTPGDDDFDLDLDAD